jgi:hypothetical protein
MIKEMSKKTGKQSSSREQKLIVKPDLFDKLTGFFQSKLTLIFWITLGISIIISLLLFDLKVSIGGDDSEYITGAKKFIDGKAFPTWHGSFYPIFLSVFMLIFGVNVTVFKVISLPLMLGQHFFLFKTFRNRIPAWITVALLVTLAVNGYILYFSSSTYSEALFFFLQALMLYSFFLLDDQLSVSENLRDSWKNWLAFGFIMFLLFLTRNIGLGVIITTVLYFLLNKKWKSSLYTIGSFLIFQLPFSLYKKLVWGIWGSGAESQFQVMFYKHAYDRAQGTEDLVGFIIRFWDNSLLYLSKHLYIILGLTPKGSTETSAFLTILTYLLFIVAFWFLFKKHKQISFLGLYLAVMLGATFISQQKHWDQYRLVLIFVPLILVVFSYGIHFLFKTKQLRWMQIVPMLFIFAIPILMLNHTIPQIKANRPVLEKNLEGDRLYGFTPDWVNYIEMCRYAAKTVPADAGIACRKPDIASIYADGRDFFGIFRVQSKDPDTLLNYLEVNNIQYVVLGSLRINPNMKTDRIINTMQNYLYYIQQKYPRLFRQVHTIGTDEGASLIEILWENREFTVQPPKQPEMVE